ncbi:hypothetical protein JW823_00355 [bacterium]|nr:hypothetical protein [candidate division CSSED10-310 bacterium]
MAISLLGTIGAKVGADLVGTIMEKALPTAVEHMKSNIKTQGDFIEHLVGMFGNRESKTAPAGQFSLELPKRFSSLSKGFTNLNLKSLSEKLSKLKTALGFASGALELLKRFQSQKLENQSSSSVPQTGTSSQTGSFGSGMSTDTEALAHSAEYASSGSTTGMGPMEMFERMQEAQRAAQMFELAVKIADIQHQAAMSAIRGIKY